MITFFLTCNNLDAMIWKLFGGNMEDNKLLYQIDELIELFDDWSCRAQERKIDIKRKINNLNEQKQEQNKTIRQYKLEKLLNKINLKFKGSSIIKLSRKYAISKTDKKIKPTNIEIQNNNEYFGSICDINKEIENIKKQILELEKIINIKTEERNATLKKLSFYKHRLLVINKYIDLLFSRMQKLSSSSRIIEEEIEKVKNIK